jgi:GT2 family glycosyltransferase
MTVSTPRFLSLCDKVVLVEWRLPGPADGPSTLTGPFGEAVVPLSAMKLPDGDGGTRIVWALGRPEGNSETFLIAAGGYGSTSIEYQENAAPQVRAEFLEGLLPAARLSLSAAMLGSWTSLFRLQRNPSFLAALLSLFRPPETPKAGLEAMFAAGGQCFFELVAPPQFGALKASYLIAAGQMAALKLAPLASRKTDRSTGTRRFALPTPAGDGAGLLILKFAHGLLVRRWPGADTFPRMESWWGGARREVGLREECLEILNASGALGTAASREFQLRCPLKQSAVTGGTDLPSARIELALAGGHGMLVGGWYRDPSGFVSGLDVLDHLDAPHSFDAQRYDFPGKVPGPNDTPLDATGFVAFIPGITGPRQQPRFLLRLHSGVQHLIVPTIQPIDWPTGRAAALRAVPPQHLTDDVIANSLAPMLAEFQADSTARIGAATLKHIGTPNANPQVSIIVPLYRVLDFVRFQIAAFASDREIATRCELIYVLDSPEQAGVVEHLLTGLHLVFGIPITLAVMPRNGGYSLANNRAAAVARAPVLALINSDVVPVDSGWMSTLVQRLGSGVVGAVGPKLLFEDDSIQHAGLYFARDHRGRWLNHHYFKGMPRHYRPATSERSVPGITGACVVMRRDLFEKIGGFTEDYVIGDYEDSDLCLKIRREGLDIVYVPDAELYHLERRSISENADYMRGVASQYNSWLHQQRWGDVMHNLMLEYSTIAAPLSVVA